MTEKVLLGPKFMDNPESGGYNPNGTPKIVGTAAVKAAVGNTPEGGSRF